MKKKKMILFNVLFVLVGLLMGISSCKDSDTEKQSNTTIEKNEPTTSSESKPSEKFFLGDGKFAHLAIHRDSLENFFYINPPSGLNSKKMVFRFAHDGNNASPIIIDGFLTKANSINFLDRPPVILESCGNGTSDLSGQKIYLSDLELTKNQYKQLRNSMGNNMYLAFYPHVIFTNPPDKLQFCVTYRMMWITDCQTFVPPQIQITSYDPTSDLNPCPPNQPGQ